VFGFDEGAEGWKHGRRCCVIDLSREPLEGVDGDSIVMVGPLGLSS